MRRSLDLLVALVAASLASAAYSQQVRTAQPGVAPPVARLDDLAWLAGEWTGEGFDSVLHENYSKPIGGQIAGHFYAAKGGTPRFYEFELITQVGNSLEFWVKHFNPDMIGSEEKDKFVRFPLVAVEGSTWYFDGLTIRRTGPDTAEHIVRIRDKAKGTESEAVLKYRRVPTE